MKRLPDPQRVLDGEQGFGCCSLPSAGCSRAAGRSGVGNKGRGE